MNAFASAVSAVVSDVAVGVVGDWLVLTTRYGLDGYATALELDDAAALNTIRGRVEGTLHAIQDIVTRHLTTPWPVTADGPVRSDSGNVVFADSFVKTEGRALRAFYAPRSEYVGWDYVEERIWRHRSCAAAAVVAPINHGLPGAGAPVDAALRNRQYPLCRRRVISTERRG